jgi:hypothetical protein
MDAEAGCGVHKEQQQATSYRQAKPNLFCLLLVLCALAE